VRLCRRGLLASEHTTVSSQFGSWQQAGGFAGGWLQKDRAMVISAAGRDRAYLVACLGETMQSSSRDAGERLRQIDDCSSKAPLFLAARVGVRNGDLLR
jgi:hypothetical protein